VLNDESCAIKLSGLKNFYQSSITNRLNFNISGTNYLNNKTGNRLLQNSKCICKPRKHFNMRMCLYTEGTENNMKKILNL